jgi:hypothetical protein
VCRFKNFLAFVESNRPIIPRLGRRWCCPSLTPCRREHAIFASPMKCINYRMKCYYREDFFSLRFPLIGNLLHRLKGLIEFDHEVGHYPAKLRGASGNTTIQRARIPPFSVKETNNIVLLASFTFRSFVLQ